eukprot:c3142_g1_i1.p1 GENE.c3142_g1_i1~~c3142_g1_i1.p1  ORF type:complete len:233 (+),score=21.42 c3142_g1_i1:35-700(+)
MSTYIDMIAAREPLLTGAFGFCDGLRLPIGSSENPEIENAYYCGWTSQHHCACVFAFGPDGTILYACINAPGSWHDATIAMGLCEKLQSCTPSGCFLIADSAFPSRGNLSSFIKTPAKSSSSAFNNALVSQRQSAEWGMRQIQGVFARLRVPLDTNDTRGRAMIIRLCCRLHQVRCRVIGLNQIRSVYSSSWQDGTTIQDFQQCMFRDIRKTDRMRRYYHL